MLVRIWPTEAPTGTSAPTQNSYGAPIKSTKPFVLWLNISMVTTAKENRLSDGLVGFKKIFKKKII